MGTRCYPGDSWIESRNTSSDVEWSIMHEIVTVQLGQKSNYLATHFWNIQESYFTYSENEQSVVDHDVHFRPGIGADGHETYTPRTIIYDLKGGFGMGRPQHIEKKPSKHRTTKEGWTWVFPRLNCGIRT